MVATNTDGVIAAKQRELQEMTPDEQRAAYLRTMNARQKPVEYIAGSGPIGNFHEKANEESTADTVVADATSGEERRYRMFMDRWGERFQHSVIGQSQLAWQMHVCRLPVFERPDRRANGTRPPPDRLQETPVADRIIRWFEGLTDTERWDLCASSRGQRR